MILFLRQKGIAQFFLVAVTVLFLGGSVLLLDSSFNVLDGLFGRTGNLGEETVLTIGETKITRRAFEDYVSNVTRYYEQQNQSGTLPDRETVENQVKDQLVRMEVLRQNATLDDSEVDRHIQSDSNWLSTYNLYANSGNATIYRDQIRGQLSESMLRDKIQALELVTDLEIENEYRRQNHKAKLKFIQFRNSDYNNTVEVADEEAKAHFEQNKEKYAKKDQINLKFVKISPQDFVSDDDVRTYYDDNRNRYSEVTSVKASHILKKIPEGANEKKKLEIKTEAVELLATIRKAIDENKQFADLAKEYSEGPSKTNGGSLGYFERGKMVPSFERACFDELEVGEVSDLVESEFGYHIIKLEDKKSEPQTFIEVKKDIKDKLVKITGSSEAKQIAEELEFDVDMDGYDGAIENELYAKLKLTVEETGFFSQDDSTIPNVGSKWTYGDLLEKVFDVEVGSVDLIEVKKSSGSRELEAYFIATVIDKKIEGIPSFENVKDKVVDDLKSEKAKELALKDANKLFNQLTESESLDDLVSRYIAPEGLSRQNLEVKESGLFSLSATSDYISNMGSSKEAMFSAFQMKSNEIRGPIQGSSDCFIIQLTEIDEPDIGKLKNEIREQLKVRKSLLQSKKNSTYNNWYSAMRQQIEVKDERL
ncbi:hypothetical protein CMK22_11515 [Candidatus Poribacteria bacterium]|nr:hypothetical protein [Candidatus Poribacteria bacterium]